MSFLSKILGDPNRKEINKMRPIVDRINALEHDFTGLTDAVLKAKTAEFKQRLAESGALDALLPEAFAAVREAARRTLNQRHYDVQLIVGIALHRGMVAEMRTGEGKTLAATLPLYLNALTGQAAHLVTVNDYLAARDATWMGQIYDALGLSVSCIQQQGVSFLYDPQLAKPDTAAAAAAVEKSQVEVEKEFLRPVTRQEAYQADITYGTNNEFGFDYLRDNMVQELEKKTQRGHHYAIIDEVDSILIDEARTPLIISAPAQQSGELYQRFAKLVPHLKADSDYNIDEKMRAATLTEEGLTRVEKILGVENLYAEGGIKLVHHLENALRAQVIFKRDKDYVVRDRQVVIVDEFTGRLMFGRRYSDGLHQAIEAKEGVKIQQESVTMASITFQNLFRQYEKLAGMTGTAKTEEEEFAKIYGLSVLLVPTHRPMTRKDLPDRIYKTKQGKYQAIVDEISKRHKFGQPILVGTVSVEKNEELSSWLTKGGIKHEILNAKNHEREAQITAQAGRHSAVTVATNMAGRGVDIILGGQPFDADRAKQVKDLGGLFVVGTERHESRRIDNQLRGRAGRQGDPGASRFYISVEDDLMRIFGSERMKSIMERLGVPENMPIENKLISKSIEAAQKKVEGHNFDIRKHLVEYDDVINRHRQVIYEMRDKMLAGQTATVKRVDLTAGRIKQMINDELTNIVNFHTQASNEKKWNLPEIYETISTIYHLPEAARIKITDLRENGQVNNQPELLRQALVKYLTETADKEYKKISSQFADSAAAATSLLTWHDVERTVLLRSIDTLWIEHLDTMDNLRQGIGLRGYGQRDPLVEYKKEAKKLFTALLASISHQVVYSIYKVGHISSGLSIPQTQLEQLKFSGAQKTSSETSGQFANISATAPQPVTGQSATVTRALRAKQGAAEAPVVAQKEKVGRNDPCPCGASRSDGTVYKYKHCGLINAPQHKS